MGKIAPLVLALFSMYAENVFLNEAFKTFGLILQGNFMGSWLIFILDLIGVIASPFIIIGLFRTALSDK
jgi:hypothetical protein